MGLAAKNLKLELPKDTSIDAHVTLSKELTLAVQFDIKSHHTAQYCTHALNHCLLLTAVKLLQCSPAEKSGRSRWLLLP